MVQFLFCNQFGRYKAEGWHWQSKESCFTLSVCVLVHASIRSSSTGALKNNLVERSDCELESLSTQLSAEYSGWIKLRLSRMLARVKLRIVGGGGGGRGVLRETREARETKETRALLWWWWWWEG